MADEVVRRKKRQRAAKIRRRIFRQKGRRHRRELIEITSLREQPVDRQIVAENSYAPLARVAALCEAASRLRAAGDSGKHIELADGLEGGGPLKSERHVEKYFRRRHGLSAGHLNPP